MVTIGIDLTSSLYPLLHELSRILETCYSQIWRQVHPLVDNGSSEDVTVSLACGPWQSAPSPITTAEIADIVEEHGRPEHVRGLAAYLQRGAAMDPEMKRTLLKLADCMEMLGRIQKGINAYALGAEREVRELLNGEGKERNVLSDQEDLIRLMTLEMGNRLCDWQRICIVAANLQRGQSFLAEGKDGKESSG